MKSRGITGKWNAMWHSSPVAEVGDGVLRPLVGLRQQHAVLVLGVQPAAQLPQEVVGLGQVLAAGALALVEVGHRVEAEAVHPHLEPEVQRGEGGLLDRGVVEVEIGLVRVEAVPVVGAGLRDPRSSSSARSP